MRKCLWLVFAVLMAMLALSGCGAARGPYVTATPSNTPRRSPTPNATQAVKLTKTARVTTPTKRPKTPTVAAVAPTHTQTPAIPDSPPTPPGFDTLPIAMQLTSGAFEPGGEIPLEYTCYGANDSPALDWANVPDGSVNLALIVTDPDSDPPDFAHWILYNLPPDTGGLPPGVPGRDKLENGALQGKNGFGPYSETTFPSGAPIHKVGYDGPCPPSAHHYVFTLYALDSALDLGAQASKRQLIEAMQGHILAQAELQGRFTPPE